MKINKYIAMLLAVCLMLSCAACGVSRVEEEQPIVDDRIIIRDPGAIEDVHLRDKNLLYKNQDPTEVEIMYLTVYGGNSAENTDHTWEEINTYSVYDYDEMGVERYQVAGLLQVGDENGPVSGELGYGQLSPNCSVQVRGQSSSRNPQKNYKISVKDNKGKWKGQTTIALNKHMTDSMRFRNKLAYDLIAEIDEMMGLRTTFVHLFVRDMTEGGSGEFEDYGLYTQVEQLNRTALKAHGLNRDGHLYKVNFFEFYRYEDIIKPADDPTYDLKAFEELLEVKGNDDHSKLIEMLEKVNDYSISIDDVLERYFDVENLSYWMAFHILTGNFDTQSRNAYLYSPLNSNKWYFYTWDNDGSMMKEEYEIKGRNDGVGWDQGISNYWGNVLFRRALKSENYRKALDAAIEDLRANHLTAKRIGEMVDTYVSVVKPYVYSMPDIMYATISEQEYDRIAQGLPYLIDKYYQGYKDSLEKPMPFYIGVPEKTENGILCRWENSFDFDAENISYSFELATDYTFDNVILKNDGVIIPEITLPRLPAGQYFIRVIATNSSGESQYAFDYYMIEQGKAYGIKSFYVTENGSIVEDVYVEN